jgi:hypothetical protein
MLHLRLPDGREATLTLKAEATVLAVLGHAVWSWDLCGRPYALVREDGATYRRALDGRLLEKRPGQAGGAPRLRQVLSAEDGGAVVEAARSDAAVALEAVLANSALAPEHRGQAERRLRRIVAMDAVALAADGARFHDVYRPVGILPPDQYLALVVQATEGCSWNACTFCDLYRDVPFRAKSLPDFLAHLVAVRAFFGESVALRRSVFLGDANALCLGQERLAPMLGAISRELPLASRGIHAFLDVWTGHRKRPADWAELAGLGLRRVYVGLETGDPGLLAWLSKPGLPEDAVTLVRDLHQAGLAVGVIVLVGAGGERYAVSHAQATARVLSAMGLRSEDLLYFSEIVVHTVAAYARRAEQDGVRPLSHEACAAQRAAILAATRFEDPVRPPRAASYDIREFVY